MSLKQGIAAPPVAPLPQEEARPSEKVTGQVGFVLVVVEAFLLTLAAGEALADVMLGNDGASVDLGARVARDCETLYPG